MVQPAPRMITAPERKSAAMPMVVAGSGIGLAMGAARKVLNAHGKKR